MKLEKYSRRELKRIAAEAYRELPEDKYENLVDLSRSHLDRNMNCDIDWTPGVSKDCSTKLIRAIDDRVDTIVREKMDGKYPKNEVKFGGIAITLPRQLAEIDEDEVRTMAEQTGTQLDTMRELLKQSKSITFFNHAWDFFCNRYGEDNVIDMVIHRDEGILMDGPHKGERVGEDHATLYFVPECISRKNGKPTISAASRWDRKELLSMHRDLDQYMEQKYGIKHLIIRSEEERATDPKNLTLREYKLLMAQAGNNEEFANLTQGAVRKADKIVYTAQKKADAIVAEAEKKAAEIMAQAKAQTRALPQMPQQTQHGGYEPTYA
jgi:hypothetical protein